MKNILKEFDLIEGNKGTKSQEFCIEFGDFKIKKLQETPRNEKLSKKRGTYFYLVDTLKDFKEWRVSSVFLLKGLKKFIFDTLTEKNKSDYLDGYYLGQEVEPGKLEVLQITREQYKTYKSSLGDEICN